MKKNMTSILFTAVFGILVVLMGLISAKNLISYYINDEVIDNEWKAEMGGKFETDIAATFAGQKQFVQLNGAIRNALGQREMNNVIKLNNGWLTTPLERCPDENIAAFVNRTASFRDYLEKRGTSLLYVSPPYTGSTYDPELPAGIEDFSNDNIDRLLAGFRAAGIDTLDIREALHEDGISEYDMMYRTDHHWTTGAGFYTYKILEKYIAEKTGCETDPRVSDINNYKMTDYGKWIGARGLRTGVSFAGTDEFTLIEPVFETSIRNPEGKTGSIPDFFIDRDPDRDPDKVEQYTYDDILGSGIYMGHYTNLLSRNDVRILIISDSFSKAVNPFLIMGFREVTGLLDSFICENVTPELIEKYDPDVVIMLYYPQYINSGSGSFDFCGF